MKKAILVVAILSMVTVPFAFAQSQPQAPVAGESTIGIAVTELQDVVNGWSAKKKILNKDVYNDKKQKIGVVTDIGVDMHDVAIPFTQIKEQGGKMVLPGATKDAIKAMPVFHYGR
ncbi:MAG: PRC-barrel domain containing protein [Thermodesulfovibrionales bacterium]